MGISKGWSRWNRHEKKKLIGRKKKEVRVGWLMKVSQASNKQMTRRNRITNG
jgi:hypothetical protein